MAQIIDTKSRGLYTDPNPLDLPKGALIKAKNTVIDRDNVLETKRGTKRYIEAMASLAKQLLTYKDRVLVHFGSTLGYDSDGAGTKVDYSGTYDAPSGRRMRYVRANQNLYFTTDEGIKRLDSLTGTPTDAGGIKALDGTAALNAAGTGFMSDATQVAYRIVWGIKDANQNLVLGAPSQRITIANSSGTTKDVDLTFTIPDGITTSHFYQIYRSGESATAADEPNDECQLVIENNPTSAEISALEVDVTDTTPNSLRGAALYTNSSQQGIANANEVPPLAKDMTVYKDHTLYANTETKQRLSLTIIAVGSDDLMYFDVTGDTHTNTTVDNISDMTGLAVGQKITGAGIPADTTVETINVPGSSMTISQAATATAAGVALRFRDRLTLDGEDFWADDTETPGSNFFLVSTGGTPAVNIADTAQSLVAVVNQSATNIYGYYLSNFEDLPGIMLFEDRSFGGSAWAATSSKGAAFSPVLPETGTTIESSNEVKGNRVYISKPKQPEAVPILQFIDVGSADDEIDRIIALRDSVFVMKKDGIFRWVGDDATNFRVTLFDNTAIIRGIDTADTLNNQVFAHSNQGVISVSDNGVQVLSRQIEADLLSISSDSYPDFETISFGVGYESERKYILFVPANSTDTYATQAYVYNTFTSSWTRWSEDRNCGVNQGDDRLYLGQGDANHVRQERKTLTVVDQSDDEFAITISAYSGTTLTVNTTADAVVGQTVAQLSSGSPVRQAVVTEVTDATHLEVDREQIWEIAAATLYDPIDVEMQWAPIHGGNPGIVKNFPEVSLFFREALFRTVDVLFSSNFSDISQTTSIAPITRGAFGVGPFGVNPWGGGPPEVQPIRTYLPLEQQRAHWIDMQIEHSEALTKLAIAGYSMPIQPVSERFT